MIDLDGNGVSDREQLHEHWKASGVVIDEEIGDDGHPLVKDGSISASTKFLVVGEIDSIRDPKLRDRTIEHLTRMRTEARAYGVRVVSLRDFFTGGSRFSRNRQPGTMSGKNHRLGIDIPAVNAPLGGGGQPFRPKSSASGTTSKLFGERQ